MEGCLADNFLDGVLFTLPPPPPPPPPLPPPLVVRPGGLGLMALEDGGLSMEAVISLPGLAPPGPVNNEFDEPLPVGDWIVEILVGG
jgi:hypothetical protein